MTVIENKIFDAERSLYNLQGALVKNCTFAGPADGESVLKEARDIRVEGCSFSLRYPFWHDKGFEIVSCTLDEKTRAPLWYSAGGKIDCCKIDSVKCLRECDDIKIANTTAHSPEFGWKCRSIEVEGSEITGEYMFFECENLKVNGLKMQGKYSFQYMKNAVIENSVLDTKDAFWHSENITVRNCTVKGEYLGWYSNGLTLENCKISGTQPLCYCKNLRLVNCTMDGCDLSFEYSDVEADITGYVESVKNPAAGKIVADKIGEIILEDSVVATECIIKERG